MLWFALSVLSLCHFLKKSTPPPPLFASAFPLNAFPPTQFVSLCLPHGPCTYLCSHVQLLARSPSQTCLSKNPTKKHPFHSKTNLLPFLLRTLPVLYDCSELSCFVKYTFYRYTFSTAHSDSGGKDLLGFSSLFVCFFILAKLLQKQPSAVLQFEKRLTVFC